MQNEHILPKENEEDNILPFVRPKPDSKGPEIDNWLIRLDEQTAFLTQQKQPANPFLLMQYLLILKINKSVLLLDNTTKKDNYFWVNSEEFCKFFKLVDVIQGK